MLNTREGPNPIYDRKVEDSDSDTSNGGDEDEEESRHLDPQLRNASSIPDTQPTSLRSTPAPDRSSPSPTPSNERKSRAKQPAKSNNLKRKRTSVAGVMSSLADTMSLMTEALSKPIQLDGATEQVQGEGKARVVEVVEEGSPARKRRAIESVQEEEDISENDIILAACLFQKSTAHADTYLALKKPSVRRGWLQKNLLHAELPELGQK